MREAGLLGNSELVQKQLITLRDRLNERKYDLVEEFTNQKPGDAKLKHYTLALIELLISRFTEEEEAVLEQMTVTGKESGQYSQQVHYHLDSSIFIISKHRRSLWGQLKDIMREIGADVETVFAVADIVDPVFDRFIYSFCMAYIDTYEKSLKRAEDEFLELSAPVVPIIDEVAVLPLVGRIDEKRTQLLLDCVLEQAVEMQLGHMFIDLTGVSVIDTLVASYIFKFVHTLELVGVQAVLVGIRPEISQTMVSLGINFSHLKTYHSLQQAFQREHIFKNPEAVNC